MREPLTDVQQKIYSFIVDYMREYGFAPTIREIQMNFDYKSSNTVVTQLAKLVKKGYIVKSSTKSTMKARAMRLVDDIILNYTVGPDQLSQALQKLKERGYAVQLNEAVELLTALNISVA